MQNAKVKLRDKIAEKYASGCSRIIENMGISADQKKVLLTKFTQDISRDIKKTDRQVEIAKFIQKIDLDKVQTAEMIVALLCPLMAAALLAWGFGPVDNKELYNKMVDITFNNVSKISAVGAFAGLGTAIFEKNIRKRTNDNLEKSLAKKAVLENSQKIAKDELALISGDEEQM